MTNEVFINYRTGDGEKIAALIDRELSYRFGSERIFFASKSIAPGERYPERLLEAVRRSHIVLAVIGEVWLEQMTQAGEDDWVRRELRTAFACGIEVIPIFDGRKIERLRAADLPPDLARLADNQYVRLDLRDNAGLSRIGDLIVDKLPEFKKWDKQRRTATGPTGPRSGGNVRNSVDGSHGQVIQNRDFTGNVFRDVHGPVHTGSGDNHYNPQHFNAYGPGSMNFAGGNQGGITQNFGAPRRDDERDEEGGR